MEAPQPAPADHATDHASTPAAPGSAGARRTLTVPAPGDMRDLGRALAALLRPGDLVLLTGELGAGKTTLARGLGEGLNVRGDVTSPTFVIARVHPPRADGPPLVHVDAYRLGWGEPGTEDAGGGLEDMEDLDLDVSLPDSVVVVEWGEGRVEELSEDRLHVVIERTVGGGSEPDGEAEGGDDGTGAAPDPRTVTFAGIGARWAEPGALDGLT